MKKILIIDDDQTFQKTMTDKLISRNYIVVSAVDGEEGLQKAVSESPDLILLDIKMPKMDGITLLKKMRAVETLPHMPVLITSNLSGAENIADGVSLGVRGYIIKSNETLDTIVSEVDKTLYPDKKTEAVIHQIA
jgi:CheY-like chemotaxis protein